MYRAHDEVCIAMWPESRRMTLLDATTSQSLLYEARASCLSYPNILHHLRSWESDGDPYIVMELVEGKSCGPER